ncbi:MAG: hypothetical protein JW973_14440 [Bacteroidales bacterium]|nr:hypothetical protein [Bacteroidales bacterium]
MKNLFITLTLCTGVFTCPVFAQLKMIWKNDTEFQGPESVVYDRQNNCLYVSNYNHNPKNGENYNSDCVSKANLKGKVTEKMFVGNLTCPTGICIHDGRLYIVERFGVVQFDLESEKVETRYRISGPGFLNDIALDSIGNIYVTVSDKATIYKISNHVTEKWLESSEIEGINGIIVDNDKLIVGVTGDSCLKSIALTDKKIEIIARFPPGIIDGIKKYGNDYLVSHFEGNIYQVHEGDIFVELTELLNTREQKIHCADFEFIDEQGLFVVPALWDNCIIGYKYNP